MRRSASAVIASEDSMILWLTTAHENDAVIPLLAKEGPGVVNCWANTPLSAPPLEEGSHFHGSRSCHQRTRKP